MASHRHELAKSSIAQSDRFVPCYRRIVVKLGTNLLTGGSNHLDLEVMASLVGQMARLHHRSLELIVVSSGAMAAGRHKLGMSNTHKGVHFRQVLASVGQSRLMNAYEQLFGWHSITVAQALLTKPDLTDRAGYLNTRNTLLALVELRVICIVNENDVVAVDELEETRFGDNDNLSAMVANLVDADLLLILSDIEGLYTADPHLDPNAKLIPRVECINSDVECLAGASTGERGIGGMATKIEAARLATASGVSVVIAHGREPDVLARVAAGESIGTLFPTAATKMESRKRWLLSGLSARGSLVVDDGATAAVKEKNRSLLPAGIREVKGEFQRGDTVNILDAQGQRIAYGIANYSSEALARIKGLRSDGIAQALGYDYGDEAVHRNNLAVL